MDQYLNEVRKSVKSITVPKEKQKFLQDNIFRTSLKIQGLSVVQIRKLLKTGFNFSNKPLEEQKVIWSSIYKQAEYFEVMSMALIFFQGLKKELTTKDWELLKSWSSKIENWEHSDRLSDLYAQLHEQDPKEIYPTFKQWNTSKKPWLKRLSIVSLFYYANSREKQPSYNKVIPLVKALINDNHIYVQKGVGWTLRELYNVYPEKTYKYLLTVAADLPPASWQAATEKLSKNDKSKLKSIRAKK